MKVVLSLHDQVTELQYPESFQRYVELLFGRQNRHSDRLPRRVISIREIGSDRYSIRTDTKPLISNVSVAELLEALLEDVVHSLIDELDSAVALHAASVAWHGRSILLPGPTGVGKTSLAGWFVGNAFEFLSDELVLLTDSAGSTVSFPRPLLAKPGTEELIAMLTRIGGSQTVQTATHTMICLDRPSAAVDPARPAGLVIFPQFVPGAELELASVSPAMAGLKLMECNLNARNLGDHGFSMLSAFARKVPALSLTYGSYRQLEGVADSFAKFVLAEEVGVAGLRKLVCAFQPPRRARSEQRPSETGAPVTSVKAAIPSATPRKEPRKITIGMATYDDYDGVYFTLQALRLYHPEIVDETEFLVVDNHPDGPAAPSLKSLENAIPNYRYVPKGEKSGTAARDWVFEEASSHLVLCIDCHVFVVPGAVKQLIDYFDAHPDTGDLLQGPLLYDDLCSISSHFKPQWRDGMYGTWEKNPAADDPDAAPFEIPMQGLGLFACRRAAWPGFNPGFRGFGGEEGYIHEKFRRAGGRTLCLPFLRWMHRFARPLGPPYVNRWEDRVRNYLIGFRELGLDTAPVTEHFRTLLGEAAAAQILERVETDLASSQPRPLISP